MNTIEVRDLTKAYQKTVVLDGISLQVGSGVHALHGPNGAGKTTLINILSTLIQPDSGSVTVLGLDVTTNARLVRARISATGQFATVDDLLTGTENIIMMARLLGMPAKSASRRANELLNQFDLISAGNKRVATYSGGMRRRLDLAISLIGVPEVLFLDEPTTGLDTGSRQTLWREIRALAANGTTVFLTTQYLEEADVLADRITVLDRGTIVAQGTPSELKTRVGGTVVQVHDEAGNVVDEHTTDGTASDLSRLLDDLATRVPEAQIALHRPTLDDVFVHLTGKPPPRENVETDSNLPAIEKSGALR
ncbi:MAG: ATP-binding cassette domain-containing protein [Acidimicrobiia bacterium]|nr:ATP-binding cassette domain-containing protein [Acidimicrobiia bacterium]